MIAVALALAAAAPLPAGMLTAGDLISAQILPPPPASDSAQARAERAELAAVERSRNYSTVDGSGSNK